MKSIITLFALLQLNFGFSQTFGPDVQFFTSSDHAPQYLRVLPAANGHLYAAFFSTPIAAAAVPNPRILIFRSTDGGALWSQFVSTPIPNNVTVNALDLTVVDDGTPNAKVGVVSVYENYSANTYSIEHAFYNLATGALVPTNLPNFLGSDPILDVAIANDSDFPGTGSSPATVCLVYARSSALSDNLISHVSQDGGVNFTMINDVQVTANYLKNIALDYGRSATGSAGQFFCAWDERADPAEQLGQIYVSSNTTAGPSGSWQLEDRLDNLSLTTENRSILPRIAVQRSLNDNVNASYTAVVVFDVAPPGPSSTPSNVYSASNSSAHFAHVWNLLPFYVGPDYTFSPDVAYDKSNERFVASYGDYNSGSNIIVKTIPRNITGASVWTPLPNSLVNDDPSISASDARICFIPTSNRIGVSWASGGTAIRAMFDSQQVPAELTDLTELASMKIFPNPAVDELVLQLEEPMSGELTVTDLNGKTLFEVQVTAQASYSAKCFALGIGFLFHSG